MNAFGAPGARGTTAWKLDALLDFEHIRDPRVVPFLLKVLADRSEPTEVRIQVLKLVRTGNLVHAERSQVADVIIHLLSDDSSQDLRLQAAIALGEFVEVSGVTACLGAVALNQAEPLELRYAVFTSLERTGMTPECVTLLRTLCEDDTLGGLAHGLLTAWHLE